MHKTISTLKSDYTNLLHTFFLNRDSSRKHWTCSKQKYVGAMKCCSIFFFHSLLHFDDFLVSNQAGILNHISVVILAEIFSNISMTLSLTILFLLNRMYESVWVSWQRRHGFIFFWASTLLKKDSSNFATFYKILSIALWIE